MTFMECLIISNRSYTMGTIILSELGYNDHIPLGKLNTSYGIFEYIHFIMLMVILIYFIILESKILPWAPVKLVLKAGIDQDNAIIRVRNSPNTHDQHFLLKITGVSNYGVKGKYIVINHLKYALHVFYQYMNHHILFFFLNRFQNTTTFGSILIYNTSTTFIMWWFDCINIYITSWMFGKMVFQTSIISVL